jgi:hypothetical protein
MNRLELAARGFEIEVDMFAECARNGLRIAEILITYHAREDRVSASTPVELKRTEGEVVSSRRWDEDRALTLFLLGLPLKGRRLQRELNMAEMSGSAFYSHFSPEFFDRLSIRVDACEQGRTTSRS